MTVEEFEGKMRTVLWGVFLTEHKLPNDTAQQKRFLTAAVTAYKTFKNNAKTSLCVVEDLKIIYKPVRLVFRLTGGAKERTSISVNISDDTTQSKRLECLIMLRANDGEENICKLVYEAIEEAQTPVPWMQKRVFNDGWTNG